MSTTQPPIFNPRDMIFGHNVLLKSLMTLLAGSGLVSVDMLRLTCTMAAREADAISGIPDLKAGQYLRQQFDSFPWDDWKKQETDRLRSRN